MSYPHWDQSLGPQAATWTVTEDKLCLSISDDRRRCYRPVLNGERIELFDQLGLMQIAVVAVPQ
ncbi:hypothetical protein [Bradyrhizobium sp. ORS 375]|uniref:hypothetical protein n=1 Tax=Bradyrhizobium sp. (strain ORS 375) TaxID=566679 RepID=UPI001111A2FB|nr:hypothetical protein [Bradyrhizobium sp. ORS 375]